MNQPVLNEWQEDLIWCPSQCYYYFKAGGRKWCIYLRWRHGDPWTAELCECDDKWEIYEEGLHTEYLLLSHNYPSDDFKFLETECLNIAKTRFPDSCITVKDTLLMTDSDLVYQFEHAPGIQEKTDLMVRWNSTLKLLEQDFGDESNRLMEQWTANLKQMAENGRWAGIPPESITSLSDRYKDSTKQIHIQLHTGGIETSICLFRGYEAHPFELKLSITARDKDFLSPSGEGKAKKQEDFYSRLQSRFSFLEEEYCSLVYDPENSENIIELMTSILDGINDSIIILK